MSTVINGSSPSITFSDGTAQTSASGSGITTVTLSSGTPGATLTSASNQYIRVVLDTTTPYQPSITLPNMTTLTTGTGRFVISNETGLPLNIKDTGGTIREVLQATGEFALNITSTSTANGVWYFNNSPILTNSNGLTATVIPRSTYMANTTTGSITANALVTLDATNFAYVFTEGSSVYAKLFTVNTSTGAFTAGNKITLTAVASNMFAWDTDNAGHAFLMYNNSAATVYNVGLSVSGGTLYASAVNSFGVSNGSGTLWCGYLGSNSAYAYGCISQGTCCANTSAEIIRGATVTGTTTVTLTQSASNTSVGGGNYGGIYVGRTSLTTFTMINESFNGNARYVSYTPASNTFTQGARTSTTTALEIERAANSFVSIAQYGWYYCSGKAYQWGNVYDVANVGTANVTANLSLSYTYKPFITANYLTNTTGSSVTGASTVGYLNSSTQFLAFNGRLNQLDPTSSNMNINISGVGAYGSNPTGSSAGFDAYILLNASYAIGADYQTQASGNSTFANDSLKLQLVPIATSIF